ncbi:MAG TPA: hypothetical protein VIE43_23300 [Thermoanaerobaculia bacterium]|jgi:hypothetical protein|nr:hypothetical protein [Thermoanaerobaculia bacterium]
MSTLYFDTHLGDEERRRRLYAGDVFVFSPRPSTKALTELARELVEEAFAPLEPQHAQDQLPVEKFVEIVGPLKPRFIHHPKTKGLLLELLRDIGVDMDKTYFDVPRMRVSTSGGYLTAGVAYVLHPHRDIWYSSPPCQLNWWLPVFPFESESSFAFHPRYWNEPVPNSSNEYNHYEWNKVGRANAAKEVKADTRKQPKPTGPLDLEPEIRVVVPPGGLILFSGAHLHSSVENTSGRTRFSIDFRTAHLDELKSLGGAPSIDRECTGTTLFELRRASDLSPVPEEVIRLYDPNPPEDRDGLVFKPPTEVVPASGM